MKSSKAKEKPLIQAFVKHLRQHEHPGLAVERWPDEENRASRDIDAIAGPFAIEHTSIDTVANQRRDNDRFMRVIGQLRQEFEGRMEFRLRIILEWNSVRVGHDWAAIKGAFRRWVSAEAQALKDGRHKIGHAAGIPFPFEVDKLSTAPPCLLFARKAPKDSSLPRRLRDLIDDKASKLKAYKDRGATGILLIESSDLALMNEEILVQATRQAYPNGLPSGIDQVWYADTSVPRHGPVFSDVTEQVLG